METWKPISWNPERYEVSNAGNVRVIAPTAQGHVARVGHLLSPAIVRGYPRVCLHRGDQKFNAFIHRLVVGTFLGEIPKRMQVNHKNGIKTDNRLENLEICSAAENYHHALDVLKHKPSHGEGHWRARFNDEQIIQMRTMRASGISVKEIATHFDTYMGRVSLITRGKIWAHVVPASYLDVPNGTPIKDRLSDDDVRSIRARRRSGESIKSLAAEFACDPGYMSRIANGLRYADVA